MQKRRVVVLGVTGSIGRQACDVIARHGDRFELVGAVCAGRVEQLQQIRQKFGVQMVATSAPNDAAIPWGTEAICEVAASDCDIVCVAIPGLAALAPTLAAIEAGNDIALATKEVLVAAGDLVTQMCTDKGVRIFPVDSEHSAIWQCLRGESPDSVSRVILTASGGPFREWSSAQLRSATPEQALAHPNWDMGPKVTIDSATMMNKGLEIIEAHHLFDMPYSKVSVVIHPTSTVHSMVEFVDGVTMAQMGIPDMRPPIALALNAGERLGNIAQPIAMSEAMHLDFSPVDLERFPAVALARECGEKGGVSPAVLNAANEQAVGLFLKGAIGFTDIFDVVAKVVTETKEHSDVTLDAVTAADAWARTRTSELSTLRAAS